MVSLPKKIGVIKGSIRSPSNTSGVAAWVAHHLSYTYPETVLTTIDLARSPDHPLPLDLDPIIPQGHRGSTPSELASSYTDSRVQAWSLLISSLDAIIIVSPQYNWSIPAPLKCAMDHLYHEWSGKPIALVTLGGHGGTRACEALRVILDGGLHARVMKQAVNIVLPANYIRTDERLEGGEQDVLQRYDQDVQIMLNELLHAAGTTS